jgi:hypothetical protein
MSSDITALFGSTCRSKTDRLLQSTPVRLYSSRAAGSALPQPLAAIC